MNELSWNPACTHVPRWLTLLRIPRQQVALRI
jgi:hypothetical protein